MTLLELNKNLINSTMMNITDIFKTIGCSSGNDKYRKPNEYIRYELDGEWDDFKKDIEENGVKQSIKMKEVEGSLCIVDGYHRITALKELHDEKKIKNIKIEVVIQKEEVRSKLMDMDF